MPTIPAIPVDISWTDAARALAVCNKTLPALLGKPFTSAKTATVSLAKLVKATASTEAFLLDCLSGKDEAISGQRAASILGLPNNSDFIGIFAKPRAFLRKGLRFSLRDIETVRKTVFRREPLQGSGIPADPLCDGGL